MALVVSGQCWQFLFWRRLGFLKKVCICEWDFMEARTWVQWAIVNFRRANKHVIFGDHELVVYFKKDFSRLSILKDGLITLYSTMVLCWCCTVIQGPECDWVPHTKLADWRMLFTFWYSWGRRMRAITCELHHMGKWVSYAIRKRFDALWILTREKREAYRYNDKCITLKNIQHIVISR